jgi:HK97 family phage prohead protease
MEPIFERRYFDAELRSEEIEGRPIIVGYAAVFNKWSEWLGEFRERIMPGAFTQNIVNNEDVCALFHHEPDKILGRTRAKTLFLEEDRNGLKVKIIPPDNTFGKDLMVSIRRGDITGMSFGFSRNMGGDKWEIIDGVNSRTLLSVKLYDVGPTPFPAYPDTSVAVRSMEQWLRQSGNYYIQTMKMRMRIADAEAVA